MYLASNWSAQNLTVTLSSRKVNFFIIVYSVKHLLHANTCMQMRQIQHTVFLDECNVPWSLMSSVREHFTAL